MKRDSLEDSKDEKAKEEGEEDQDTLGHASTQHSSWITSSDKNMKHNNIERMFEHQQNPFQ